MITVNVQVRGLDQLRSNFKQAPNLTLTYLAKATTASIAEIEKNVTEGGIMQYRTPRSKRSGHLVSRWGLGDARGSNNRGLRAWTGPSVNYAWNVYVGYRTDPKRNRTIYWGPNKYMDRIADAATPGINRHFQTAVDTIVAKIAKI
jgi:hypothetical protein